MYFTIKSENTKLHKYCMSPFEEKETKALKSYVICPETQPHAAGFQITHQRRVNSEPTYSSLPQPKFTEICPLSISYHIFSMRYLFSLMLLNMYICYLLRCMESSLRMGTLSLK